MQNPIETKYPYLEDFPQSVIRDYLERNGYLLENPSIKEKLNLNTTVSVVVPVYNERSLVTKLLQALNKQACDNFEVIIVDNGSTDKTTDVIKDFKKGANYPLYVTKEPNPGVAHARKRGMDEVLIRLMRRGINFCHFLAITDADIIPPEDWIAKISSGFKDPNMGGLAGTHGASEEVERKIEKATGISNYFNIIPSLIEFLEKNGFGSIKMSGPNSAFTSVAYALGNGIKQEYDHQGKPKLSEVNNLGRRVRTFGYSINPMWCKVIKNRRRELFEILNNVENSYFPQGYSLDGRFSVIRENEMFFLDRACKTVPKRLWEIYRYKMVYKVIRNFIFQPLIAGEIKIDEIQRFFIPEEIEIFLTDPLSLEKGGYTLDIFKNFLSRLESKLYE